MSRRRGLARLGRRRRRTSANLGPVAAATATAAAAIPLVRRASSLVGRERSLARQAHGALQTVGNLNEAVSRHGSTIGKAGAVISQAARATTASGGSKLSHLVEQHTDIAAPRSVVYNQWTQMETFPALMKAVKSVEHESDTKTRWSGKIGPVRRTWTAEIVEQVPDERIRWKAEGAARHEGVVSFHRLDDDLTRVQVEMKYSPSGALEVAGNTLRVQRRRVKRELRLFKHFVELRGSETGAWRGRVSSGDGDGDSERGNSARRSRPSSGRSAPRSARAPASTRSRPNSGPNRSRSRGGDR